MSEDNSTVYEYCILSEIFKPPVIRLTFQHYKNMDNEGTSTSEKYNDDDGDDDNHNHYYNEVEDLIKLILNYIPCHKSY
jgi:hypothetical protein